MLVFHQPLSLAENVEPGEGPADACILRVALALPFSRLYDYLPPSDCPSERLVSGHRVCVPFKAGARIGFLIEITDESPIAPEKLRRAIEVLDQAPVIGHPPTRASDLGQRLLPSSARGGRGPGPPRLAPAGARHRPPRPRRPRAVHAPRPAPRRAGAHRQPGRCRSADHRPVSTDSRCSCSRA